ncbi:hypothetical protein [Microbispora sp. GKU 823]|uniref:hypothetical protein n=1 Tax=Microbispora sp. GKU 823 TaxID=1652100 RepID=UPI0009A28E40|nr:hypothetical protein [Microbispora sp. GKU 823]OPG13639.1 hypothetical protein B1L11_06540 [Microbispora sp. GKU 823]
MTTFTNTFSGGSNGTTITTGNSGGTNGDAFTGTTGSPIYSNTFATGARAPMAAQCATGNELKWIFSVSTVTRTVYLRAYVYMTASPTSKDFFIYNAFRVYIDTSRRLSIGNNSGVNTSYAQQTGSVPLNQWCRIEAKIFQSSTTNASTCELRRFDNPDSTVATETTTATGMTMPTALATGITFSYGGGLTWNYDDLGVSDTDWLGPAVTSLDATATPGVVAATSTAPAASVAIGAGASPSVVAASASIPGPGVTAVTRAQPAAVTASATIPGPNVTAVTRATPGAVSATTSVPAATARAGASSSPATASSAAGIPAPSAATGSSATPGVVTATSAVPAPGVVAGQTVTAQAVTATAAIPSPTPSTGQTSQPGTPGRQRGDPAHGHSPGDPSPWHGGRRRGRPGTGHRRELHAHPHGRGHLGERPNPGHLGRADRSAQPGAGDRRDPRAGGQRGLGCRP